MTSTALNAQPSVGVQRVRRALLFAGAALYVSTIASGGAAGVVAGVLLALFGWWALPAGTGVWAALTVWTIPAAFVALTFSSPGSDWRGSRLAPLHPADVFIWLTIALAVTSRAFWAVALTGALWNMKLASACTACLGALQIADATAQGRARAPGVACIVFSICTCTAPVLEGPLRWVLL